jgi:hypothetical protein
MKEIDFSALFKEYYPLLRAYCIARFSIDGYGADFYEGFDFTDVWTMKNGMPELKIFG